MISAKNEKKIVIFGAGDIGRQALNYYGRERVAFYVDNSNHNVGKTVENKLILSWEEYLRIEKCYDTVVAIWNHLDVDKQLFEKGIPFTHFLPEWQPYWQPRWQNILNRVRSKFSSFVGNSIILLGVDDTSNITEMIIDQIRFLTGKDFCCVLCDIEEGKSVDNSIYEDEIIILTNDMAPDDIIITDPWRSRELEVIARSYFHGCARITNPFFPIRHNESDEVISNPYIGNDFPGRGNEKEWQREFTRYNDIEGVGRLAEILHRYAPLFRHVEIETVNRCNGACAFCPVSAGHDIRERKEMSDELFYKIIEELSALNFDGRVALFSNNEPFLDPKIIDRQKYAYEHLPNAKLHLFTNGSLLTLKKFKEIISYLDEMVIDNYNQDLKLNPISKDIAIYCEKHPELKEKVSIVLRKPDEILTSRGGDAPNRKDKRKFIDEKCVLPFEQLIIRPDGKVSLCCNDPYGRMTLGDLNKQTMKEVWYGEEFKSVRDTLMKGRGYLPHCQFCDTFYYSTGT